MAWTWTGPESLTEPWSTPYGDELAGEGPWTEADEDLLDDAFVLFAELVGIA